jgi:hypothetical protein
MTVPNPRLVKDALSITDDWDSFLAQLGRTKAVENDARWHAHPPAASRRPRSCPGWDSNPHALSGRRF